MGYKSRKCNFSNYIKVADGAVTPITVTFVNTDRAVQRIEAINPVTAGTYGSLSSEDEVKAKLPKEVQVVLSDGTKTPLKVASWTNTDGYTTESPAGSYTFTVQSKDELEAHLEQLEEAIIE